MGMNLQSIKNGPISTMVHGLGKDVAPEIKNIVHLGFVQT